MAVKSGAGLLIEGKAKVLLMKLEKITTKNIAVKFFMLVSVIIMNK